MVPSCWCLCCWGPALSVEQMTHSTVLEVNSRFLCPTCPPAYLQASLAQSGGSHIVQGMPALCLQWLCSKFPSWAPWWFPITVGDHTACLCWARDFTGDTAGGLRDFQWSWQSSSHSIPSLSWGEHHESFVSLVLHLAVSHILHGHYYWSSFSVSPSLLCFSFSFLDLRGAFTNVSVEVKYKEASQLFPALVVNSFVHFIPLVPLYGWLHHFAPAFIR